MLFKQYPYYDIFLLLVLPFSLPTIADSLSSSLSGGANLPSMGPIKSVVVVGGTHGNEYTGVWCIKALDRQSTTIKEKYPSLDVSTLFANPKAHLMNKRFVDVDLNRQFTFEALHDDNNSDYKANALESLRAREINSILGPKFDSENQNECVDVVIDLHSTTADMGLTILVSEGDVLMTRAAAYVLYKCGCKEYAVRCLLEEPPNREDQPFLVSAGIHGFTVEVGPVPQGVLRHDAVEMTQDATTALLEFLHRHNIEQQQEHEEEKSTPSILDELYTHFPTGHVPCYRDAPGKLVWPCDSQNENFPNWMVHKSIQDQDFATIYKGDKLFIDLDGNEIEYDGAYGSPIYLAFINEGGYYYRSSGTGIGAIVKGKYDLVTGQVIDEESSRSRKMDKRSGWNFPKNKE